MADPDRAGPRPSPAVIRAGARRRHAGGAGGRYTPGVSSGWEWLDALRGRFLVFEGPDGSGKTTQLRRLAGRCRDAGLAVCEVREPGGTDVGERIRAILLDHAHRDMSLRCEMMLYMASRAQLVEERIRPALGRGELVLADRFVPSTLAYQGAAGGLPEADIRAVARVATMGAIPDLIVIFDVDEGISARRVGGEPDRMEAKGSEYHRRVRQGYLAQVRADPVGHARIDAGESEEEVWRSVVDLLRARVAGRASGAGGTPGVGRGA